MKNSLVMGWLLVGFGLVQGLAGQGVPPVWVIKAPDARSYHAMAFDSARNRTVLFGGVGNSGRLGGTWEWNGTIWTQASGSGPSPRSSQAMAFDSARGRTVLFGGIDDGGVYLNDTWEWNGTSWTLNSIPGPSARYFHAMTFDSTRGRTVLFGGYSSSGYLGVCATGRLPVP